jgi:hypothetical protein
MAETASKPDAISVAVHEGEDVDKVSAKVLTGPLATNGATIQRFGKGNVGDLKINAIMEALAEKAKAVRGNDLSGVEETLVAQAMALDTMFSELSRRAALNMGTYLEAARQYMGLALKAQNQCRMTLETLATIKNPPIVYARQANIAHGAQQVNNGTAPTSQAGESGNAPNKLLEASHEQPLDTGAPQAAGEGDPAVVAVGAINRPAHR